MSKLKQKKYLISLWSDTLVRMKDNNTKVGQTYIIKYNEKGILESKELGRPQIGYSVFIDEGITWWLTTAITAILEESENYIKFKTLNSIYEWKKYENI